MLASREVSILAIPLYHKIRDGIANVQKVHRIAYYLEYITMHMKEPEIVPALKWIVRNGLLGEKFLSFVTEECSESGLELIRHMRMRIYRDGGLKAITAKELAS